MKRLFSSRSSVYFAGLSLLLFTSCNRGVGCPTNFSVNEILGDLVKLALGIF